MPLPQLGPRPDRGGGAEILTRLDWLEAAPDKTIVLADDGSFRWRDASIGRLLRGDQILTPRIQTLHDDDLPEDGQRRLRQRLDRWWMAHLGDTLGPLIDLSRADLNGPSRGLAFQVCEGLGAVPRKTVKSQVDALARDDRQVLRKLGLTIGRESVFMTRLMKAAAVRTRGLMWSAWQGGGVRATPPPGRVSIPLDDHPTGYLNALGYQPVGPLALRMDMLERLAGRAWSLARKGPFVIDADMVSLAGCGIEEMALILKHLGFAPAPAKDGAELLFVAARKGKKKKTKLARRRKAREPRYDPDSPFAKLRELALIK